MEKETKLIISTKNIPKRVEKELIGGMYKRVTGKDGKDYLVLPKN